MRWKKLHWWNDILGGWLYVAASGEILAHVYRFDGQWCADSTRWTTAAQAKAHIEAKHQKEIDHELAKNLEDWYLLAEQSERQKQERKNAD